ncbi:MAG TPA: LuxR C-terminal-related transcriptional regulator [Propionibacteriaceae bacterium]|nr:LuxR C-terminal-related transcriptional regulator [Propionibacteriaceae bacterium]
MPEAAQPSPRDRGERTRLVALPGGQDGGARRVRLPSPVSSFVGREDELEEIIRLLRAHRLVTLTGTGGSGKTRLALAVAADLLDIFPAGLWVVELASVTDPDLVPHAVAGVAGIAERPEEPLAETLGEVLNSRSALLVLDNCEHLVEACARLADALLPRCPALRILATSREALGITGEVTWPVPPLRQAVRLFTERAQAVRPSFTLTEESTPAVTRIATQLDGLPLALELAAARVRVLSVQEIASRLGDALRLLVGERMTAARHHTLKATFDWSHALLSPAEQVLFRRLSVFRGGFTLSSAEAVCAGDGLAAEDVLDRLALLVEKSLVIADQAEAGTRYRLLEVVRQYADQRRLAAGELDAEVRVRHAAYFLALAEEAEQGAAGLAEPSWFNRLSLEHDNLRAALTWLVARPADGPEAAQLAAALWPFWFARGFPTEGIGWLQAAVGRCGDDAASTRAKAKALNGLVVLAVFQEDYDRAWACGQECLALYRTLDDADGIAASLTALSTTAVASRRTDVPVSAMVAEARSLQPRLQDRRVVAFLRDIEGVLALQAGDPALAVSHWRAALDLHREIGNRLGAAFILANLGLLSARLGDLEQAAGWLVDGLRLSHDLDYKLITQYCLIGLGNLAALDGRLPRAARLWGAAEAMTESYGTRLTRATRAMIDYDRQLAEAQERLDAPTWAAAWAEGRRMTTDQAVRYALADDEAEALPPEPHPSGLTGREVDVLRLVAAGLTSADVGQRLFLSPRTVDWHLSSIYTKLGVHSRTEATRFALSHGLG